MRALAGWAAPILMAIATLVVVTWFVRWIEPRLAFFPLAGQDVTPAAFGIEFTPVTVATDDGAEIRLWHLPRADARARVVYFHGNGGNLSIWTDILAGLWQEGFDVTAVDYRGYGLSTGEPSEQGLYRDVDATLRFVQTQSHTDGVPLIYWGRSLGTPLAAYAATRHPPRGVVLEAGFPSARSVLETNPVLWLLSFASTYRFATSDWMATVRQPSLVLHGDRDSVIPYRLGRRLYDSIPGPKTFITIPGGDHNDAVPRDPKLYWNAIKAFVDALHDERS
jgi:fermentation-respiration switch protein FrsA (DUF1100 family)